MATRKPSPNKTSKKAAQKVARKAGKKVAAKKGTVKKAAAAKRTYAKPTVGAYRRGKVAEPKALCDDKTAMDRLMATLADPKLKEMVRYKALSTLQNSTFSAIKFERHKPKYLATLRQVANQFDPLPPALQARSSDDNEPDLRREVMAILAGYEDNMAQDLLVRGLDDPAVAVVPQDTALQLLSNAPHSGVLPAARRLAAEGTAPNVRLQALRLLSNDAQSQPVLEQVFQNKGEEVGMRKMAGAALRSAAPSRYHELARAAVLDDAEVDEVKALSLLTLRQGSNAKALALDVPLAQKIGSLALGESAALKGVALSLQKKFDVSK